MTSSTGLSARSFLTAGMSTAVLGAAVLIPTTGTQSAGTVLPIDFSAVLLSAAVAPLAQPAASDSAPTPTALLTDPAAQSAGNAIINAYDFVEPWVAYGFELAQWALSFVPGLWWIAPAIDLAYFTAEPIVQSLVYSFAFLIDGQIDLIGPTLTQGVNDAVANFIEYSINWITSLVPFPPLPPFPIFPSASVAGEAVVPAAAANLISAASAETVAVPETSIASPTTDVVAQPVQGGTAPAEPVDDQPAAAVADPVTAADTPAANETVRPVVTPVATEAVTPAVTPVATEAAAEAPRVKRPAGRTGVTKPAAIEVTQSADAPPAAADSATESRAGKATRASRSAGRGE